MKKILFLSALSFLFVLFGGNVLLGNGSISIKLANKNDSVVYVNVRVGGQEAIFNAGMGKDAENYLFFSENKDFTLYVWDTLDDFKEGDFKKARYHLEKNPQEIKKIVEINLTKSGIEELKAKKKIKITSKKGCVIDVYAYNDWPSQLLTQEQKDKAVVYTESFNFYKKNEFIELMVPEKRLRFSFNFMKLMKLEKLQNEIIRFESQELPDEIIIDENMIISTKPEVKFFVEQNCRDASFNIGLVHNFKHGIFIRVEARTSADAQYYDTVFAKELPAMLFTHVLVPKKIISVRAWKTEADFLRGGKALATWNGEVTEEKKWFNIGEAGISVTKILEMKNIFQVLGIGEKPYEEKMHYLNTLRSYLSPDQNRSNLHKLFGEEKYDEKVAQHVYELVAYEERVATYPELIDFIKKVQQKIEQQKK
jgi:hypothetical protein